MDAIDQLPYDACKPLAFRVLTKLANVAAQDGTRAWRLNGEMATELGVDVRSIYRALDELEKGGLIRKGDQRAVSHWQGNRRPTVWDIVMHHGDTTLLPLPVDDDDAGVTEISTGPLGVTPGMTTVVAHREQEELLTKTPESNQTGAVTPVLRTRCSMHPHGAHSFDSMTGWCVNACGLRHDPTGGTA